MNLLAGALLGVSAIPVASLSEWVLHKYGLHMPKEKRAGKPLYIINMAEAHHDEHHRAFKGPAHYYRDVTNEDAVSEFSANDHKRIRNYSVATGIAGALAIDAIQGQAPGLVTAVSAALFAGTAILYDHTYEFTHHYMHEIGERRLHINRKLGEYVQGGESDGRLRLSKPLLDDICTIIDNYVDKTTQLTREPFAFSPDITDKLRWQIAVNRERQRPRIETLPGSEAALLDAVTRDVCIEEQEKKRAWSNEETRAYDRERRIQRILRNSRTFQFIDNHHFLHHFKLNRNFNVVLPIIDMLFGTYEDSSKATLDEKQQYWLCPNSPDTKPFPLVPRTTRADLAV